MCCNKLVCFSLPRGHRHVQCQQKHKGNIVPLLNLFNLFSNQCSHIIPSEISENVEGVKWEHWPEMGYC